MLPISILGMAINEAEAVAAPLLLLLLPSSPDEAGLGTLLGVAARRAEARRVGVGSGLQNDRAITIWQNASPCQKSLSLSLTSCSWRWRRRVPETSWPSWAWPESPTNEEMGNCTTPQFLTTTTAATTLNATKTTIVEQQGQRQKQHRHSQQQ